MATSKAPSTLNPNAKPFVPLSTSPGADSMLCYGYYYDPEVEEAVTSEELEELEACEEWCETMAELAESEREHLISLALSQAPLEKILEVEMKHELLVTGEPKAKGGRKAAKGGNKSN